MEFDNINNNSLILYKNNKKNYKLNIICLLKLYLIQILL